MALFFLRITTVGVFVGSFILYFFRSGSWPAFQNWIILRVFFSLFAALVCAGMWIMLLEGVPAFFRWIRSFARHSREKVRNFWISFKDGLFVKDENDLAENIREHMRNFRTFMWISLVCGVGAVVSFAVFRLAGDTWFRTPGMIMVIFSAGFLPASGIYLQSRRCLWRISSMNLYMSNQEVTQAIVGTFSESGRIARLLWRDIFPHLLKNC